MGEKRVGVARKIDEKQGCTVMVSIEAKTSQILPAFIIFKGGFCKRLMHQWKEYKPSNVVFTKNH